MLLGAIIGIVGGLLPEVIKFFKDRQEHKQQLELLEMQLKYQQQMTELKIQEAKALSEVELDKAVYSQPIMTEFKQTGTVWLDALQIIGNLYVMTTRPTLSYLLVVCWIIVKIALWQSLGGQFTQLPQVWTDIDGDFVASVIAFWFSGRQLSKVFNRK